MKINNIKTEGYFPPTKNNKWFLIVQGQKLSSKYRLPRPDIEIHKFSYFLLLLTVLSWSKIKIVKCRILWDIGKESNQCYHLIPLDYLDPFVGFKKFSRSLKKFMLFFSERIKFVKRCAQSCSYLEISLEFRFLT